ncbi:MAG: hypothetical protein P8N69_04585 [Flavobacteriales bacterium]|nr:hypothetical protein [Flavobacteriales bacterium]
MFKSILIFINIIGFLIFTILNVGDIENSHKIIQKGEAVASKAEIGKNIETEVKIVIGKNEFSGPGRLRLDFSNATNISVKEKVNDGSSFTFKNNEALFIWYDLPNEKDIEITYTITADEKAQGMKKITGDFSFINDNERKQLEINELIFNINKELKEENNIAVNKSASVNATRTIEKMNNGYLVTISTKIKNHKGFARIKEEIPAKSVAVAIETSGSVFKNIDGYAKFIWSEIDNSKELLTVKYKIINESNMDTNFTIRGVYSSEKLISEGYNTGIIIPESNYQTETNYLASLETSGIEEVSDITADSVGEIIIQKPVADSIKVELLAKSNSIKQKEIEEENSSDYLRDVDQEINNDIDSAVIATASIGNGDIKFTDWEPSSNWGITMKNRYKKNNQQQYQDSVIEGNSIITAEQVTEIAELNNIPKDTQEIIIENKTIKPLVNNVISSKKINNNIQYKVQILAGHRIIGEKYLFEKFNYKGDYDIESHLGWIKYTIGNHSEYQNARDSRNEVKINEFPGPFVSAYNYGERISVQEALIISKQNWVP